ncbi:MAG: hypothetical protein ACODAU_07910 [Myxococcota bacterium]
MENGTAEVLGTGHGLVVGAYRNLFIVIYTGPVDEQSVRFLNLQFARFRRSAPSPYGLYTVVEEQVPLPSGPVRQGMANLMKDLAGDVVGSALVQEGDGFRASAVRSVAVGISLLARQPFPHKVFAAAHEASTFLSGALGGVVPDEISSAVATIRRQGAG